MEPIVRDVAALAHAQRLALEDVIGHELQQDQRLVIQVVNLDLGQKAAPAEPAAASDHLPEWCHVYEGLSDAEINDLETAIVRSTTSRLVD